MGKEGLNYKEFIELAKANYTKGGADFVECWEEYQFDEYVKIAGPITVDAAMQMFGQADRDREV